MNKPIKQHVICPEVCIRCYTCEMTCPIGAIEHDDNNVVVNADICNFCMECIPVCPTGSIDEWRIVQEPYSLEEQYEWMELPEQEKFADSMEDGDANLVDPAIEALLLEAHIGAGGKAMPPKSASKPVVALYGTETPAQVVVQGNYRLTDDPNHDVRHIIFNVGDTPVPVLEGQTIGVVPPGNDANGKPHNARLYSVSNPRDGERPGYNNISLTVKRDEKGICSNYICDLEQGDVVNIVGPFGSTFLMPDDPSAHLLMICTGTGAAPMRAFTMRRQRVAAGASGGMTLFFGARSAGSLPYFGPLAKVPQSLLTQNLVFSRDPTLPKEYVQDRLLENTDTVVNLLMNPSTYIYICGLRDMEAGVEAAMSKIASNSGQNWKDLRDQMRTDGRYHVETY